MREGKKINRGTCAHCSAVIFHPRAIFHHICFAPRGTFSHAQCSAVKFFPERMRAFLRRELFCPRAFLRAFPRVSFLNYNLPAETSEAETVEIAEIVGSDAKRQSHDAS